MTESSHIATVRGDRLNEVGIRLAAIGRWADHAANGRVSDAEASRAMAGLAAAAQRFVSAEAC